mmetsp:Transcript_45086/g.73472  ORF Transcript_45086/g.73472 Transcript_45086/m.73472 type:complete len:115 (+) Transcript_45086:161-505(+)
MIDRQGHPRTDTDLAKMFYSEVYRTLRGFAMIAADGKKKIGRRNNLGKKLADALEDLNDAAKDRENDVIGAFLFENHIDCWGDVRRNVIRHGPDDETFRQLYRLHRVEGVAQRS